VSRDLVHALGFVLGSWGDPAILEDNTACINWGNNVIGGCERAKHISIRKHYAYEAIQLGHIRLVRVSTADQLAHVLIKLISRGYRCSTATPAVTATPADQQYHERYCSCITDGKGVAGLGGGDAGKGGGGGGVGRGISEGPSRRFLAPRRP
jgi:hypothetical protein